MGALLRVARDVTRHDLDQPVLGPVGLPRLVQVLHVSRMAQCCTTCPLNLQ